MSAAALAITSFSAPSANAAGYPVYGKILDEYNQASAANGKTPAAFFGDTITPEANDQAGGRFQKFYRNNSIYWNPNVSNGHANQIGGDIRTRWVNDYNYEVGPLKYPTTRELSGRKTGVRFNRFQGGNMYYSPSAGTHPVWGGILSIWGASDYEAGRYGMPKSDEYLCSGLDTSDSTNGELYGGWGQTFEGGWITYLAAPFQNKDSAAPVNRVLGYRTEGSAGKYYSEIYHSNQVWGALGSVQIVDLSDQPEKDPPLVIKGEDRTDVTYAGLYDPPKTVAFAAYITLNDAYLEGYGNAGRESVTAHEFGHALGLLHSCQGQLMDPYASRLSLDITSPQFMDIKAYRDMWG